MNNDVKFYLNYDSFIKNEKVFDVLCLCKKIT